MVNRSLFASSAIPHADTRNAAGGKAYQLSNEEALVQYAFTGTMSNTFYTTAETHLETILGLCKKCDDEFIAKCAISARADGYMKDMPAMLAAILNTRNPKLLSAVFSRIITNGKILKNFVAIVRSGKVGRRGFGTTTKRAIRKWFTERSDSQLMYDNIGGSEVRLDHILRMCRPTPENRSRSALFAWIRGAKFVDNKLVQEVRFKNHDGSFEDSTREYAEEELPEKLRDWLHYQRDPKSFETLPKLPIQMLMGLPNLTGADWDRIARCMSWRELLKNLNTLQRHGVFDNPRMVEMICRRLADPAEIQQAKIFPYEILSAFVNTGPTPQGYGWSANYWAAYGYKDEKKGGEALTIPKEIRNSLEIAVEESISAVPCIQGTVFVAVDTSGSMGASISGNQTPYYSAGRTKNSPPASKVRCIDAASLVAAAVLRKNPMARVLPFSTKVHDVEVSAFDSVMKNAEKFASLGGGGTACSAPLALLNSLNAEGDIIIVISDYESHNDANTPAGTAMRQEWNRFHSRNPKAKLICLDLTPRTNHQVDSHPDILRIGGFSDSVFSVMSDFVTGKLGPQHWVGKIEEVQI